MVQFFAEEKFSNLKMKVIYAALSKKILR